MEFRGSVLARLPGLAGLDGGRDPRHRRPHGLQGRAHLAAQRLQWDQWNEWTKNHAYNRSTILGQGGLSNAIEGTLRQVRRAFTPSSTGNFTSGLIFYSMATSNVAVASNPFTIPIPSPSPSPPGTPARSFAEFASALTTGGSVDSERLYEDPVANPVPVFPGEAFVPDMPWKSHPVAGHLMGFVRDETGEIVDTGAVTIARNPGAPPTTGTRTTIVGATDGGGFYGGVDLAPGTYRITITPVGQPAYTTACTTEVTAGRVGRFDVAIDPSRV